MDDCRDDCKDLEGKAIRLDIDAFIEDLVIGHKKVVTFKDVCCKLNVTKSLALESLEKISKNSDQVQSYYVVSGTTGSETKIFIVSSKNLQDASARFQKIDFKHIHSLGLVEDDDNMETSEPQDDETETSGACLKSNNTFQKVITDFFDTKDKITNLKHVLTKDSPLKSKTTQMSIKNFTKPIDGQLRYRRGSWLQSLNDEFKVLESSIDNNKKENIAVNREISDPMSSQDDAFILEAGLLEDGNGETDLDMSSLDNYIFVEASKMFEEEQENQS